jgi:hypothetical protein
MCIIRHNFFCVSGQLQDVSGQWVVTRHILVGQLGSCGKKEASNTFVLSVCNKDPLPLSYIPTFLGECFPDFIMNCFFEIFPEHFLF